jgi:hypothetical protein
LDDVGDPIDQSMTDFQITSFDSLNLLNPQISARIGGRERFWPCEQPYGGSATRAICST